MAGVDPLVAEVAGDLEDTLVAPHHEALQVQLRGDAEAELDVECVRPGQEGAGQGPARLRLQDRGLDLDEVLVGQQGSHRGDGLEPHVEDGAAVGVGQEVDLPLAVPGVGGGQPVPLVGQGTQGLGQQVEFGDVDGQLPPPARHHLTLGSDPVAQVEVGEHGGGALGQGPDLHQQLDRSGHVLQRGERQPAVSPDAGQPSGDPGHLAGACVGSEVVVALVETCGGGRPLEAVRIGIDPLGLQHVPLPAPLGAEQLGRSPGSRVLVPALVGRRLGGGGVGSVRHRHWSSPHEAGSRTLRARPRQLRWAPSPRSPMRVRTGGPHRRRHGVAPERRPPAAVRDRYSSSFQWGRRKSRANRALSDDPSS